MEGASRLYRRGVLAAFIVLLLVGSLLGGSLTQGQAQTAAELKTLLKLPLVAPSPDEGSSGTISSAEADSGSEGRLLNVQVSRNQNSTDCVRTGASETTIVRNDDGLVAGYNDGVGFAGAPFFRGPCAFRQDGLSGYAFSTDDGGSWTVGGAPPVGNVIAFGPGTRGCSRTGRYVTRGDPWLDADDDTIVYANLAQWNDNPELATSPCAPVPPAGISVHFGAFHDDTFTWHRSVLLQSPNYPNDFLDKESVTVDRRSRGAIFVTTTNFIETCGAPQNGFGQIELYRSLNGGATWNRRIVQPDESFITDPANVNCGAHGIVNQGSASAIGPSGDLNVVWERGWLAPAEGGGPQGLRRATIAFRMSTNRGATFGPLRTIKSICSQAPFPPAGYNREQNNDFPRIAVAQEGRFEGRIFVAFQDCSAASGNAAFGRDTDIYVAFSDNFGVTWTIRPVHPTADGKVQFWPVPSVGKSGEVRVVYYEDREVTPDPAHPNAIVCSVRIGGPLNNPILRRSTKVSLVDVMEAVSRDGGETYVNRRVTTQTTNWCKATPLNSIIPNFGDYIDARGVSSKGLALWADGRNRGRVDAIPTVFFGGGESEPER